MYMSAIKPTEVEKEKLQKFYLATRSLLQDGIIPAICVQRSFEEAVAGFQGKYTWHPTHISPTALVEAVHGSYKNLQRAHGVVGGRLDRYERTMKILQGEMMEFDTWWVFWQEHDSTVLITREEHSSNRKFVFEELVALPDRSHDMFTSSGFSFKFRKKNELAWLRNKLQELSDSVAQDQDNLG